MFQLLYLRFTQPRADAASFSAIAAQARALVGNQNANPDIAFNRTIEAALGGDNRRRASGKTRAALLSRNLLGARAALGAHAHKAPAHREGARGFRLAHRSRR